MNILNKTILFWGICDLGSIVCFIGVQIYHNQIPFYHDVLQFQNTISSFGLPSLSFLGYVSVALYISLILSGILFLKHSKSGAILSYIQCPFRLLTFIPPSLFFITWPIKYIFDPPSSALEPTFHNPALILFVSLILLCETFKLTTVIIWHKKLQAIV